MADELVTCPYNPAHQIIKRKLQTHLVKCEKQYVNLGLVRCPYNSTHRIHPTKMQEHKTVCPDRVAFEKRMLTIDSGNSQWEQVSTPSYGSIQRTQVEEDDWDDEVGTHHYNPRQATQNLPVLRSNTGLTPAEKRAFQEEERKRILKIKNENENVG